MRVFYDFALRRLVVRFTARRSLLWRWWWSMIDTLVVAAPALIARILQASDYRRTSTGTILNRYRRSGRPAVIGRKNPHPPVVGRDNTGAPTASSLSDVWRARREREHARPGVTRDGGGRSGPNDGAAARFDIFVFHFFFFRLFILFIINNRSRVSSSRRHAFVRVFLFSRLSPSLTLTLSSNYALFSSVT